MVILGGTPYNEIQDAVSWYIGFLEYKIRESWINLFSPVLKDTDRFSDAPSREDLSVAFQILRIVALDLSGENFALTDIVDKLYNEKVLAETDEHRSHANQLVCFVSCKVGSGAKQTTGDKPQEFYQKFGNQKKSCIKAPSEDQNIYELRTKPGIQRPAIPHSPREIWEDYTRAGQGLHRLFWDSDQSNSFLRAEVEDAMEFYREVLLSYRLIFGQDNISHKRFNKMFRKSDLLPKEYHDSLIFILCGQHWDSKEARHVYELIDAEDPSTHYSPTIDFPYLGTRLLELQTYVKDYKPSTFCAIWNDKRDPSEWWTFWAVILMGSMTLIVTILLGISQ
ncbi:uncharacterized protein PAC_05319 [Phialocephala subalpina]|uniref:Uncharacterized protein n=1 Tax=Phialocephala subalpina TaxID=576137 RepID=A0A1L7WRN7_9HELO|nr:uncharacterized protein PAC_05319 [Phialocephala subalpina]